MGAISMLGSGHIIITLASGQRESIRIDSLIRISNADGNDDAGALSRILYSAGDSSGIISVKESRRDLILAMRYVKGQIMMPTFDDNTDGKRYMITT